MQESLVKTLLHDVFGILAIICYPLRHGKSAPLVTRTECLESVRISTPCGRYQRGIGVFACVDTACINDFHGPVAPLQFGLTPAKTEQSNSWARDGSSSGPSGSHWRDGGCLHSRRAVSSNRQQCLSECRHSVYSAGLANGVEPARWPAQGRNRL